MSRARESLGDPNIEVGKQLLGSSGSSGNKTGIKADDAALKSFIETVDKLGKALVKRTDEAKALTDQLNQAANAAAKLGNAGQQGGGQAGYNPSMQNSSPKQAPTSQGGGGGGGQQGGGGGGGGGPQSMGGLSNMFLGKSYMGILAGQMIGQALGQLSAGVDARADRNRDYALPSNRVGQRYQLTTGASQDQYLRARQQMANYRLDVTEMMGFQTTYGAAPSAQSVEGLRAMSGWQKSTAGVLQDQSALMDPTVANRMFMMTGVNAYKIGGGLNDPIKMYQQLSKRFGLTDENLVKTARMPGSVTRAALTDAGLPAEVIDNLLDYAQSNIQFKAKGGLTDFDPSNRGHMKSLGLEDQYATQVEETLRTANRREEKYQEDQLDSMAKAEKNSQRQIELLSNIEGHLAWLTGKRIETKGWQQWAGRGLQIAGIGAMALNAPAGMAMIGTGGFLAGAGDPTESAGGPSNATQSGGAGGSNDTMVPFGYGNNKVSISDLQSKSTFASLNPKMRDRLTRLFKASGGRVGIGQGSRDTKQQESMFRDRYQPTTEKTGVYWNGTYWKHVKGAAAAPPGRSMHEIGLAADLVGDLDWLQANAGRFGLKTFAGVNNEPWHVQPTELPNSRRQYEEGGASWGTDGGFAEDATFVQDGQADKVNTEHPEGSSYLSGFGMRNYAGLSISQILDAMQSDLADSLTAGGVYSRGSTSNATKRSLESTSTGTLPLSGESGVLVAAQAAYNAGFRGEDLYKIVAIAGRESGWQNKMRTDTSDTGIWQINWAANERHARTAGAKTREDLLDPNVNARAAFELYKASGFHGWRGSDHSQYLIDRGLGTAGWDPNGNEMWRTDKFQEQAREAITSLNLTGDPMERVISAAGGGGSVHVSSPVTITVSPQITIMGSSNSDLRSVASQVVALIEEGVREANLRGS